MDGISTARLPRLDGAAAAGEDPRGQALEVARRFEAVLATHMVSELRETTEALFGDGPGADTYAAWFDRLLADRLSEGPGLGVTHALMTAFERAGAIPPAATEGR